MTMKTQKQIEARRAYMRAYMCEYAATSEAKATRRRRAATPEHKAWLREYQRARRAKYKATARLYLGGVCVSCGADKRLEFDHINSADKSFNISTRIAYAWAVLVKELDKCQLLCKPCHRVKTNEDRTNTELAIHTKTP